MKIIKHEAGQAVGRVNLIATLETMEAGEAWVIEPGQTSLTYAQQACYHYGLRTGRKYWCSSRKADGGKITIRRDK